MSETNGNGPRRLAFNGYHRKQDAEPDWFLCRVGRGTPGGEYLRRFWQPVAYLSELEDVPLRIRALGEDLVAFRDKSGRIGVLHLHCSHRNASLEFGIVEGRGLRCCYHGRLFDVDGTILEIPGEPAADRLCAEGSQGAYPTHSFGGILFIYMGPPEDQPVFPLYDRFVLPGVKLVPGTRWPLDCNWIQIKENAVDPHHTKILHVIPQMRGMDHFSNEFGNFPTLTWAQTPGGVMYLAARRVGENVWLRSAEILGANLHTISSIFETGHERKRASLPFMSIWTLPVDDDRSVGFYVSHVTENEPMPFEKRRYLEDFGQTDDRSYRERQWIPGDYEAQLGQGPVNIHALEQLGTQDRGIVLFRRLIRRGIEAVSRGEVPQGFYRSQDEVPPSFANDCVVPADAIGGDADDPAVLRRFADRMALDYRSAPPMAELRRGSPAP
jgi:phenylpropionate dioxygenase-like ring-hydroxylating dioxygenase large terminal subunit